MANEKRLIDANALRDKLYEADAITMNGVAIINQFPTVDAVEVVRCKDCKHKGWIQEPCHGKSVDYCRVLDFCINNADKCFCSYGERREGE